MAEQQEAQQPPAAKPKGKTVGGAPKWVVILGGGVLVGALYIVYRRHQAASAAAAANTSQSNTATPPIPGNFAGGLATDQASAIYAQLMNVQQQLSNENTPQQSTPTPTVQNQYTFLPWKASKAYDLSLNDLAQISGTTSQAIIANSEVDPTWTNKLKQYFDAGNYDAPIPQGESVWLPFVQPASADLSNLSTDYASSTQYSAPPNTPTFNGGQ